MDWLYNLIPKNLSFYTLISILCAILMVLVIITIYVLNLAGLRYKIKDIIFHLRIKVYILYKVGDSYKVVHYMRVKKGVPTFTYDGGTYYVNLDYAIDGIQIALHSEPPVLYYEKGNALPLNVRKTMLKGVLDEDAEGKPIEAETVIATIDAVDLGQQLRNAKYHEVHEREGEKTYWIIIIVLIIAVVAIAIYSIYQQQTMSQQIIELTNKLADVLNNSGTGGYSY